MLDLLSMYLKYFPMTFFSLYIFKKISNLKVGKKLTALSLIVSLMLCSAIIFLRENVPWLSMIIFIIGIIGCDILLYRQPLENSAVAGTISFGIACAMHPLSSLLTIPFYLIIHIAVKDTDTVSILADIVCFIINSALCIVPFRFKRLKNGMSFLQKEKIDNIGVIIAFLIPLATAFFDFSPTANFYFLVPMIYMCMSCLLLFFWWRSRLKKSYFEELRTREINTLKFTIEQQSEQLVALKANNDNLSEIIHADNKVIPAMEKSVNDAIAALLDCNIPESKKEQLQGIIDRLQKMDTERKGFVFNYEANNKALPATNAVSVDATANYMAKRAADSGIAYDLTITDDIKKYLESTVPESDFNTLLADLTENAIIATSFSDKKHILVVLGTDNGHLNISVIDSGIGFEASTFKYLGIRRNTTHKSTGGSGIGLMTTIEYCRKYKASFIIDEDLPEGIYAKKVEICFDGQSEIRVKTKRPEIVEICRARNEITLI